MNRLLGFRDLETQIGMFTNGRQTTPLLDATGIHTGEKTVQGGVPRCLKKLSQRLTYI
jgi:hypothetical protein